MKISQKGEFGLIERIKRSIGNPVIGSDCAPIKLGGETYLATCDILLEGRHFLRNYPPAKVGAKAIAVNVSDIVASGGIPQWVLVSLMIPDIDVSYADKLYAGIKTACMRYGCQVIGGNVTKSEKIGIDIFMIGKTDKFIPRRSARIGDSVFVTGNLGDSKAGLELLTGGKTKFEVFEKTLIRRHLEPEIDIKISGYLVKNATSSMDVSDGFSSDIYQLFDGKKFQVNIDPDKIPISKELKTFCEKYHRDALSYALTGGEDYKIMFTGRQKNSSFVKIGDVNKGKGIFLGKQKILKQSFDHFTS